MYNALSLSLSLSLYIYIYVLYMHIHAFEFPGWCNGERFHVKMYINNIMKTTTCISFENHGFQFFRKVEFKNGHLN
jgi:hypothetical protein